MCEFLSFCVDVREGENYGKLYFGEPASHSGIEEGWGLNPGEYGEAEWTKNDSGESLTLRGCPKDMKATILSKYPTRRDLFKAIPAIGGKLPYGGNVQYEYKRGNLVASVETRHYNGKRWEKCTYKDGELHGPHESWRESGERIV